MRETARGGREWGLLEESVGDGRPLLLLVGLGLVAAGGFALFLAATRQFLPHDIAYLGMTADELCAVADCRVADFMVHDRVAFGGSLVAIGVLYLWLVAFPLAVGEAWAWWALATSGAVGFASFLAYLGYGYLDLWHATATAVLLPCFVLGMLRARAALVPGVGPRAALRAAPGGSWAWGRRSRREAGRLLLLVVGLGMVAAGLTITALGMTRVFVPQDLAFIGMEAHEFHGISPRLVPLIAHDRAGYGGATATAGLVVAIVARGAAPSRALWQALVVAGTAGFGAAIGIHPVVGYDDAFHLAPAVLGAFLFGGALALLRPGAAVARETGPRTDG